MAGRLIDLSDMTRKVMGQNVWLAFGLSLVLIALAIFGVLDPLTGAICQSLAVLAVAGKSARILRLSREHAWASSGRRARRRSTHPKVGPGRRGCLCRAPLRFAARAVVLP
jgi:hypothetical protein